MKSDSLMSVIPRLKAMVVRSPTLCAAGLVFLLIQPGIVQAQFTYNPNMYGGITVTGYNGPGGVVSIPGTIDGLPVNIISGFSFNSNVTSFTIPDSVFSIEDHSFWYCANLTNVAIGSGVAGIGYSAFTDCPKLVAITVDEQNPAFSSLDGVLFDRSRSVLRKFPEGKAGDYLIPDSVTSLWPEPFANCTSLTNVTTGNGLTAIDDQAFHNCTSLISVVIGSRVISVGHYAFWSCPSLAKVIFPEGLNIIGKAAFSGCASLSSIAIPETVAEIWPGAFSGCTSLTNVTLPSRVTMFGGYAFSSCTGLTSITIPNGVGTLANGAFSSCTGLTNVTIPGGVTIIEDSVFEGCGSLTSVVIPESVTSLGNWAFESSGLTNVAIPSGLTVIGVGAFSCPNLQAITVHALNPAYASLDGVLFNKGRTILIEYPAGKARNYTVPNGVLSIGDYAFYESRLTNITFSRSVTNFEKRALQDCPEGLKSFTMDVLNPAFSSVDGVLFNKSRTTLLRYPQGKDGNYAVPAGVDEIAETAFVSCPNLGGVNIPNSVTSVGFCAFCSCSSLTSVLIGDGVTSIADSAFGACPRLAGLYFKGNAPVAGADVFVNTSQAIVYYLPGTSGWTSTFAGNPTAQWQMLIVNSDGSFGVRTNRFGFGLEGVGGLNVVVEASTNLPNPAWTPLRTNTLTGGSSYFSDPQWTNYPSRTYRLRSL